MIPRPSEVEDVCTGLWWENLKQTTLEGRGVNERIMLKLTLKMGLMNVDKIHPAQNREQS